MSVQIPGDCALVGGLRKPEVIALTSPERLHRIPDGDLCLFYAHDVPALRWEPGDGVEVLLAIAQRHFAYEEYRRRHGVWPVEDAPHGEPARGTHPIRSVATRRAAEKWRRKP